MDDETGERDETDRTHDVTTPGPATLDAGADGVPAGDPPVASLPPSSQVLHPLPVQPRRSPAIWAIVVALVGVLVLVVTVGAHAGALALSGVLAVAGVCRAVTPGAVVGLAVRSRTFDVLFYLFLAAAVAVLTQTTPDV
ncbi:hypothetical protein Sked_28090 [Sanguibacter keddieii DSM 10542]|uniref:DUF3017 domain-containing protein n=1 Tax=Sanguibacter keddieii (strain ATCC 51767 / DSM 10542 / NCFB 3025 / ST-74) TaxID=446469 RepID=D1BB10_SANKS|nr:DUF3017 domain-containing protein [Sanguibacter keddieii]ACZ22711.1 hypothetical protein Sked_28090 [Sanguibacter keddieii DSM 10542]